MKAEVIGDDNSNGNSNSIIIIGQSIRRRNMSMKSHYKGAVDLMMSSQ